MELSTEHFELGTTNDFVAPVTLRNTQHPPAYTYLLTAVNPFDDRKFYIGSRSGTRYRGTTPLDDVTYYGSSAYVNMARARGVVFEKTTLQTFETHAEALRHEIELHAKHDVARDKTYFNVRRQTSEKWTPAGVVVSPETRAKQSAIFKAMHARPEVKARHRSGIKAAHERPEVKAKQSAASKAMHARPEVKAKRSVSLKAVNARPEVKAKRSASQKAACARPEVKAKRSASQKASMARPDVKAKLSASQKAAHARPETKARRNASLKAANARPEVKAKRGAAVSAWCKELGSTQTQLKRLCDAVFALTSVRHIASGKRMTKPAELLQILADHGYTKEQIDDVRYARCGVQP